MTRRVSMVLLVLVTVQTACAAALPRSSPNLPPPKPQSSTVPETRHLRIDYPGTPTLADIPFLMALDALRQEGYAIETVQFARFDLVTAALVKGDLDIANASHQSTWAAIAKGAPIRSIVSYISDQYLIIVKPEIQSCADLNNKTIAYGSTASVNAVMLHQYIKRNCPTAEPQVVVIPSTSNRVSALLAGATDAAVVETEDALQLDRVAAGRFHVLRRFAEEFPEVEIGGYTVRQDFAAQYPERVKDFVRALVSAQRRIQDEQVLRDAVVKYLGSDAVAPNAVETYLSHNAWDVNGGLTRERIQTTLDFLTEAKMLEPGLRPDQVADLSYLNAMLDEMGRK